MVREELAFDDAVRYTQWAGEWIAAQLNVVAVTVFIPLSLGTPTQCLSQLSYLPTLSYLLMYKCLFAYSQWA